MDFIFDPSLVLYLPLHRLDGSSSMSQDAYGHSCTVTGAIWQLSGYLFDGTDDRINCGSPVALDITDDITLDIWFNATDWGGGTHGRPVAKGTENIYEYAVYLNTTGVISLVLNGVTGSTFNSNVGLVILNNWINIAITRKRTSGEVTFYGNGALNKAASGGSETLTNNTAGRQCWVGSHPNMLSRSFKGFIGEVRIYNRALTPLEIQHNYLATKWRYR